MTLALFQNQTLPARRPSEDARQYAYRIIRKFILELHLLPGQKMNEADLASSLNMSRTQIIHRKSGRRHTKAGRICLQNRPETH